MSAMRLPVADGRTVRRRFLSLLGEHKRAFTVVTLAQLAAAVASVGIPSVSWLTPCRPTPGRSVCTR